MTRVLAGLLLLLSATPLAGQGTAPDSALLAEIRAIRAVDNHAHPLPLLQPDARSDRRIIREAARGRGPRERA